MGRTFKNRKTRGEDQENRIRYYTVISYLTCNQMKHFLISNFCHAMNVAFFRLGDYPHLRSMCGCFGTTLSVPLQQWCKQEEFFSLHHLWRWNWRNVLKRQHIKFRHWGITPKERIRQF